VCTIFLLEAERRAYQVASFQRDPGDDLMQDVSIPAEPLRRTLIRNFAIATIVSFVASRWMGGTTRWPLLFVLALWPTFGGHFVELAYLRWVRPRYPDGSMRVVARVIAWLAGGALLALGLLATARFVFSTAPVRWPGLWFGAVAFVGIELLAHAMLQLRGAPSFYNQRG
jgi:hypothetical protein